MAHAPTELAIEDFAGWRDSLVLRDDSIELVVTTAVGPRIIAAGLRGGRSLLWVDPETTGASGGDEWHSYGGHRFWHAPEDPVRTYTPDNVAVQHAWDGRRLAIRTEEPANSLAKELTIELGAPGTVEVRHRLTNTGSVAVELAPWAITVCAPGGRAIVPQELFRPHPEALLPARPLVLWHYTDMSDPRFTWGRRYVQVRQVEGAPTKAKIGMLNRQGWAAYLHDGVALIKRFGAVDGATYPDLGCNTELFTDGSMLELETLGPLRRMDSGDSVEHVETWLIAAVECGDSDDEIDASLLPLVERVPLPAG